MNIMMVVFAKAFNFPFANTIIAFLMWIDAALLKIFSWVYENFIILSQHEFFNIKDFENTFNNIYLIIGVVALFFISYVILKAMVEADDKNKGASEIMEVIIRFVVSMILIALLPTIFGFLRDFQHSLITYSVVPKIILDGIKGGDVEVYKYNLEDVESSDDENEVEKEIEKEITLNGELINGNDIDWSKTILKYRANYMTVSIITGLMYPLTENREAGRTEAARVDPIIDHNGNVRYLIEVDENKCKKTVNSADINGLSTKKYEWCADVSEFWTQEKKIKWTFIAAGAALIVVAVVVTVATFGTGAGAGAASGSAGVSTILAGLGGAAKGGLAAGALAAAATGTTAYGFTSLLAALDAHAYTWSQALAQMYHFGDFSQITLFATSVKNGYFHYTPILSTIVIGYVVYMMVSFCIDVVVRQAKLLFYQLLAPICFLISVVPAKKDLLSKWLKLVLTVWLELFIRLATICILVLFIGRIDFTAIISFSHPILSTFIVFGLVIFAKQIPKLFSDLTGLDSSNMKLNLKEKLAEGGFFAIGSAAGSLIARRGNPLAAYRGWKAGMQDGNFKNVGAEVQRRRDLREARRNGSTFAGRMQERARKTFGIESAPEQIDRRFEDGYDLLNNKRIEVENDTKSVLEIRDENGVVVSTINVGDRMHMTRDNRDILETTKKANAVRLSKVTEEIRNIDKSSSSNSSLSSMRSDIKQEALDKISEDKSTYTETITLSNGKTFSGNYQSLLQQRDKAKSLGTLSDSELDELTVELGKTQDKLWEKYAKDAINDTTGAINAKIRNLYQQMEHGYNNGYLQSDAGESYDRTLDTLGLNTLSGFDLVKKLDEAAKTYNNKLNLYKQKLDDVKSDIDEQNTIIDRMNNQYTEYIDAARRSRVYTAATANKEYVNKDVKK